MSNWLDGIKVGDKVILSRGYGPGTSAVRNVERATKTMIVVGMERFRRKDGRLIGGSGWSSARIEEAAEEALAEIERNALEGRAKRALCELCDERNHLSDKEMDWLIEAMESFKALREGV